MGATGFVGRAVTTAGRAAGLQVDGVMAPRIVASAATDPLGAAGDWIARRRSDFDVLLETFKDFEVVVNAAALATPESGATNALLGANAVLPAVLAEACSVAGVRRLVHVSSAAVQGRREPLDESDEREPLTPYARAKALGEEALATWRAPGSPEVAIYRATSVQGADRPMTRQLVRLASAGAIPVTGRGDAPLPLSLIQNVAAGIVHVCRAAECPDVVLQPWEGMTSRSLAAAFGAKRVVALPAPLARAGLGVVDAAGRISPRVGAISRRLDLILLGQAQSARALEAIGFPPPDGYAGYVELAATVRAQAAGAPKAPR